MMAGVQKRKIRWAISLLLVMLYFSGMIAQAQYGGGSGEPNDPYLIYTAEQMNAIGGEPNDWDKHFKLMADIDLSVITYSMAVIPEFTGVFDGSGHKISNFTYSSTGTNQIGLFGHVSGGAAIKDLGLIDTNIHAETGDRVGSLVGYLEDGTINTCYVEGGIVSGNDCVGGLVGTHGRTWNNLKPPFTISNCYSMVIVVGHVNVGGLVGYNYSGPIDNCYAMGSVWGIALVGGLVGSLDTGTITNCCSTDDVSGDNLVGGLVGSLGTGSITNCYSTGGVSGNNTVGGLIGFNNNGTVTNCYSVGSVKGNKIVGSLMGNNRGGTITNCYSTGTVMAIDFVGGLVGSNNNGTITNCYSIGKVSGDAHVGGLVGRNFRGTITNCYSTGSVSGDLWIGGLVGSNDDGTISGCFWDIQTSGQVTSAGGMAKKTAEMQMSTTFYGWGGWDNEGNSLWTIDEGEDYPRLWWENTLGHVIEPATQLPTHATSPSPADGAIHEDKWVSLSWLPGVYAVSHRVYVGDNFDDVNNGTSGTFRGNRTSTYYVVGIPGSAYPDGLVPGKTYYWRIDEVYNIHSETPCRGDVWSFTVAHKIAYNPSPPDGAVKEDTWVSLGWSPGDYAVSHDVYFGDNFEDVNEGIEGTFQGNQTGAYLTVGLPGHPYPDGLVPGTTYYWRVDEVNDAEPNSPWKGDVWSFWIPPMTAYAPDPVDGAEVVDPDTDISWTAGLGAKLHTVYFGDDFDAINNAVGNLPQETTTYDPGPLKLAQTYYWRIDEVNDVNPDSPWIGPVWSFTTANFIIVDDFESYNDLDPDQPGSNRIFNTWIDGYRIPTNGSLVDIFDEHPPGQHIVAHGGAKSMWYFYGNSVGISEATANIANLAIGQNWTIEGVGVLSLWFYGYPDNAPEPMYVALANANDPTAVVYHDNPNAALIDTWTEWRIYLQEVADQGVNLVDVNSITLGFGNRSNPVAGGSGEMWFDDIRLYRPVLHEAEP
ncbi:MAG: GLUG motif-containing protein [Phycisphaerae bacterium]